MDNEKNGPNGVSGSSRTSIQNDSMISIIVMLHAPRRREAKDSQANYCAKNLGPQAARSAKGSLSRRVVQVRSLPTNFLSPSNNETF